VKGALALKDMTGIRRQRLEIEKLRSAVRLLPARSGERRAGTLDPHSRMGSLCLYLAMRYLSKLVRTMASWEAANKDEF